MSASALQLAIEKRIEQHGGLRAAARALDICPVYLCRLRKGQKSEPGPRILKKLGLRRVISYEIIR